MFLAIIIFFKEFPGADCFLIFERTKSNPKDKPDRDKPDRDKSDRDKSVRDKSVRENPDRDKSNRGKSGRRYPTPRRI